MPALASNSFAWWDGFVLLLIFERTSLISFTCTGRRFLQFDTKVFESSEQRT